jgi:hypothetical protein
MTDAPLLLPAPSIEARDECAVRQAVMDSYASLSFEFFSNLLFPALTPYLHTPIISGHETTEDRK